MRIEVHCEDSLTWLRGAGSESVHLTVTSPPYDNIRDYKGKWSIDLPEVGRELLRVTAPGGMCAMVMQDGTRNFGKSGTTFRTAVAWMDAGWKLFETVIWERRGRPGGWWKTRFRVDHEYVLLFLKGDRPRCFNKDPLNIPTKNPGSVVTGTTRATDGSLHRMKPRVTASTMDRGTVWHIPSSKVERSANKSKFQHPATFPDRIAADLITCFSSPGDIVFDPFLGSGTTLVAAKRLGRSGIGVDISHEYCALARSQIGGVL